MPTVFQKRFANDCASEPDVSVFRLLARQSRIPTVCGSNRSAVSGICGPYAGDGKSLFKKTLERPSQCILAKCYEHSWHISARSEVRFVDQQQVTALMAHKSRATETSQGQQTISSFFSKKRKRSPTEETLDSDVYQPAKKTNSGEINSPFLIRDSTSPEEDNLDSSLHTFISGKHKGKYKATSSDTSANHGISKWGFAVPSSDDTFCGLTVASTVKSSGKRNGKASVVAPGTSTQHSAAVSFREKLRRRDLSRKEVPDNLLEISSEDRHAMDVDGQADEGMPDLAKIIKNLAAEGPLPWEKETTKTRKAASVIGPAGLPCTPLEEAVRIILSRRDCPSNKWRYTRSSNSRRGTRILCC